MLRHYFKLKKKNQHKTVVVELDAPNKIKLYWFTYFLFALNEAGRTRGRSHYRYFRPKFRKHARLYWYMYLYHNCARYIDLTEQ